MTRKSICLLFLVLLALPCFAASKYESKITSLEGEKWWGGAVGLGSKMPFEGDLRLFDLSAENLNNQNVPLLLLSAAVSAVCIAATALVVLQSAAVDSNMPAPALPLQSDGWSAVLEWLLVPQTKFPAAVWLLAVEPVKRLRTFS